LNEREMVTLTWLLARYKKILIKGAYKKPFLSYEIFPAIADTALIC